MNKLNLNVLKEKLCNRFSQTLRIVTIYLTLGQWLAVIYHLCILRNSGSRWEQAEWMKKKDEILVDRTGGRWCSGTKKPQCSQMTFPFVGSTMAINMRQTIFYQVLITVIVHRFPIGFLRHYYRTKRLARECILTSYCQPNC